MAAMHAAGERSQAVSVIEPKNGVLKTSFIIVSTIVLGITLSAGLWPFSFHKKNDASWRPQQEGLYFGATGMAISKGKFLTTRTNASGGCSIELWIEPAATWDSSTILSFYEPGVAPRVQIGQSGDDVKFTSYRGGQGTAATQRNLFADHAFRKDERVLVTLTSIDDRLSIYVNGVLKRSARSTKMQMSDFSGILILANAQDGNLSWSGTYRGLALYDRALLAAEVNENYHQWQNDSERIGRKTVPPYALYLFNEGSGEKLHNVGRQGPDLEIPKNYFIFEPRFLVPFWKEYQPSWDYAKDLAINVFGLVPAGCCLAALIAWISGSRSSLFYATLLGFGISLTIEILQAFMPTRFSGTTDLITNTAGAALGAWAYLNGKSQAWLERIGVVRRRETRENLAAPREVQLES
jgi:VanZ family protein